MKKKAYPDEPIGPGGLTPEPRDIPVDVSPSLFEDDPYDLKETNRENIPVEYHSGLRDDWITAWETGNPLYVVGDDGKMWQVTVGGDGKAITTHPIIPRYEVQEGGVAEYRGPDAFVTIQEDLLLDHYQVIPMQQIEDSNVEAHVATVRNPIWFKAVRCLVENHRASVVDNPYKT